MEFFTTYLKAVPEFLHIFRFKCNACSIHVTAITFEQTGAFGDRLVEVESGNGYGRTSCKAI